MFAPWKQVVAFVISLMSWKMISPDLWVPVCVCLVHSVTLFLNVLACLAYFTASTDSGVDFGLSILWFLLFTPVSFVCWYRPVYKAFRYTGGVALSLMMKYSSEYNSFVVQAVKQEHMEMNLSQKG